MGFFRCAIGKTGGREKKADVTGACASKPWTCIRFTSVSIPAPGSSRRTRRTCTQPTAAREDESRADHDRKKIAILGGGPNRIGQGIEFDYCCVHAAYALKDAGYETIMVNCNPETVSTDYDTSDRLYFEPLTAEDVTELLQGEMSKGELMGVIVQLGGQTPLKLAHHLEKIGHYPFSAPAPMRSTLPKTVNVSRNS